MSLNHIRYSYEFPFIPYTTYKKWWYMLDLMWDCDKTSLSDNASAYELSLTTKRRICEYELSAHPMHVLIKFNASTDYTTKNNRRTEAKWF